MERIIDVIKVLGKRGLAYRQSENEAACAQEENTIDHGNFLELILLLGKYDFCLKKHIDSCIEMSKKLHQSGGTRGRGSLVTLCTRTTMNSVVDAIHHLIQEKNISSDIKKAGLFSVQLDTLGINKTRCIGNATDRASNRHNPDTVVIESGSMCPLLNNIAVFIRDS